MTPEQINLIIDTLQRIADSLEQLTEEIIDLPHVDNELLEDIARGVEAITNAKGVVEIKVTE